MKQKLTILFFLGALIFVTAGIVNYKITSQDTGTIYEELGSIYEIEPIDLKRVYTDFGIEGSLSITNKDLTVIYLTDYSECANTVIEIKEFSNILDSLRDQENLVINEAFLLLDEDSLRAEKELKILNLTIPSGFAGFNFDSNKLMYFGEKEIATNQIIFVDGNQRIRFRNKLSGIVDLPISERKELINKGIKYTLKL